jgi:hypothetical protein
MEEEYRISRLIMAVGGPCETLQGWRVGASAKYRTIWDHILKNRIYFQSFCRFPRTMINSGRMPFHRAVTYFVSLCSGDDLVSENVQRVIGALCTYHR